MDDNLGTSIIKINTKKGMNLFDNIKNDFELKETDYNTAYAKNHKAPIVLTSRRYEFFNDYIETGDVNKVLFKYNQFKDEKCKLLKK
jgi:hypothetical protein